MDVINIPKAFVAFVFCTLEHSVCPILTNPSSAGRNQDLEPDLKEVFFFSQEVLITLLMLLIATCS